MSFGEAKWNETCRKSDVISAVSGYKLFRVNNPESVIEISKPVRAFIQRQSTSAIRNCFWRKN